MELRNVWGEIKELFETARMSSMHYAMATVDGNGNPHVTPIGSLILRDNCTGYYFEEFPAQLVKNLDGQGRISVMALNSDADFWLKSLSEGRFGTFPGMRLTGVSLGSREASQDELDAWLQRVKFAAGLKGHDLLWKDMKNIRELQFHDWQPVLCGEMTAHLLK